MRMYIKVVLVAMAIMMLTSCEEDNGDECIQASISYESRIRKAIVRGDYDRAVALESELERVFERLGCYE